MARGVELFLLTPRKDQGSSLHQWQSREYFSCHDGIWKTNQWRSRKPNGTAWCFGRLAKLSVST